ncbi:DUF2183 domain-containing protein [Phaeobacter italicus]|uniref:phosphatase domain-containing protein n=1 Tax=Phaeobacter italicus TaxID=481446 RepID=UPI001C96926B|nr:phosphatase domain-containing protein [Phaeobacter italicus]MBY5978569.1 DUF2183 domain-containing protein [Phaeobacter italicus]MEC8573245.1 phosphatase domain-containing protein [Pseudomonadota bacterium]
MLRSILQKVTLRLEQLFSQRPFSEPRQAKCIEPHIGYATADTLVLRGRALAEKRRFDADRTNTVLQNIMRSAQRFVTSEVADVAVRAGDVVGRTDEEGYFQLTLPFRPAPGWHYEDVFLPNGLATPCPALVPHPDAPAMLISDIDDTVLRTRAWSLISNLWTTFSGNVNTREMHKDAIEVYAQLQETYQLPIYYVSSSPWNLHSFLNDLFHKSKLPSGPMFLRDLGVDETKFITSGHGSHKGDSIDILMHANPQLPAILCGDSGQEDARIYRDAVLRHPGRVRAVVLRTTGDGLDEEDAQNLKALRETGVPVFSGLDFRDFLPELKSLIRKGET